MTTRLGELLDSERHRTSAHPDIEAVVTRMADPEALTASLNLYQAILPPRRSA